MQMLVSGGVWQVGSGRQRAGCGAGSGGCGTLVLSADMLDEQVQCFEGAVWGAGGVASEGPRMPASEGIHESAKLGSGLVLVAPVG